MFIFKRSRSGEALGDIFTGSLYTTPPANQSVIKRVKEAWLNPGKVPRYHRMQQQRLKKEWPMLYSALVELCESK